MAYQILELMQETQVNHYGLPCDVEMRISKYPLPVGKTLEDPGDEASRGFHCFHLCPYFLPTSSLVPSVLEVG